PDGAERVAKVASFGVLRDAQPTPQLLAVDGRVHLWWAISADTSIEQRAGGANVPLSVLAGWIYHATSEDGGRTWSKPDLLAARASPDPLTGMAFGSDEGTLMGALAWQELFLVR